MRYRKKPIVVEAIQWDGTVEGMDKIKSSFKELGTSLLSCNRTTGTVFHWSIITLEGMHVVSEGDYIIKGINGEFYPCKPDIFEKTYEAVE
jgi:hypothetical protein